MTGGALFSLVVVEPLEDVLEGHESSVRRALPAAYRPTGLPTMRSGSSRVLSPTCEFSQGRIAELEPPARLQSRPGAPCSVTRAWRRVSFVSDRLGVDSVTFDTFGWEEIQKDETARGWQGDGMLLAANFFARPPDLPSLDPQAIRAAYEQVPDESERRRGRLLRRVKRSDGDRTRKIIDVAVNHEKSVPIVRSIARLPFPDRYVYSASFIVPLAACSWVVQVQAAEEEITGLREAVALQAFLTSEEGQERLKGPSASDEDEVGGLMTGFDAYEERWDGLVDDPLTRVRRHADRIERSLAFTEPVLEATPFG